MRRSVALSLLALSFAIPAFAQTTTPSVIDGSLSITQGLVVQGQTNSQSLVVQGQTRLNGANVQMSRIPTTAPAGHCMLWVDGSGVVHRTVCP